MDEFFRVAPVIIAVLAAGYALVCRSRTALWLLAGLLLNGLVWRAATALAKRGWPDAAARPCTRSCSFLENGKPTTHGGMPSGHCQSLAFAAVWMVLAMWAATRSVALLLPALAAAALLVWGMMRSRAHRYRCHTMAQAGAGSALGAATALLMWPLAMRW